ncbi:MAG: hypothetical protein Q8911_09215 [Bacillota bacterium]|nr:hypothetical protein [Bacillota bacterium]
MSNFTLNNYSTSVNTAMKMESGERSYPIWLLLNPKYPAVRHDIWTPILDEIQDKVYRKLHTRIDTQNIFVKNAVSDIGIVPNTLNWWAAEVAKEIEMFRESVLEYQPKILITFGAFPYEFVRRVFEVKPQKGPKYWSTSNLREEFEHSIADFDISRTNRIPLLRRVITNGKFIEDRNYSSRKDSENYFHDVGKKIAEKIIENKDNLKIWIE